MVLSVRTAADMRELGERYHTRGEESVSQFGEDVAEDVAEIVWKQG